MRIILFKIILFFFTFILSASSSIISIPYSNYNTPSSLINYLSNNKTFSSSNSTFFQFAFYISIEQSKQILGSMTSLYQFSNLSGIILVLDKNSNIENITTYSNELLNKSKYKKENTYIIILQYDPEESGEGNETNLYINVGGETAEKYLNETSREALIEKWGKVLKNYNYDNFSKFFGDFMIQIFLNRDNKIISKNSGASVVTIIVMFAVIILILGMCVGCVFYAKRRYDIKSKISGEINVNSALF